MELKQAMGITEAVLFSEGDSVQLSVLSKALDDMPVKDVKRVIKALEDRYNTEESGLRIIELEDAVQLSTKTSCYDALIKIESAPKALKLSDTVLETLSIIAYRQPVTKAEIQAIRGVNSDFAVDKLLGYGLVQELGRKDAPGRPILFGTTEQFLRSFGVKSIADLPTLGPDKMEEFREEAEQEADEKVGV